MGKTDKELAVELAIEIIKDLRHEPMINKEGKPVDVEINGLLNSCYKAVSQLGNDAKD